MDDNRLAKYVPKHIGKALNWLQKNTRKESFGGVLTKIHKNKTLGCTEACDGYSLVAADFDLSLLTEGERLKVLQESGGLVGYTEDKSEASYPDLAVVVQQAEEASLEERYTIIFDSALLRKMLSPMSRKVAITVYPNKKDPRQGFISIQGRIEANYETVRVFCLLMSMHQDDRDEPWNPYKEKKEGDK